MSRRPVNLLLATALLLAIATPVHAQRLKIATVVPEGSAWMREMRAAAAKVKQDTEGRVQIKLYPGGVMGGDKTVLRKVRAGQLHGGAFTSGSPDAECSRTSSSTAVPLLFRDYRRGRLRPRGHGPEADHWTGLEANGWVASLSISDGGFAYMLSQKPSPHHRGRCPAPRSGVQVEDDVMSEPSALEVAKRVAGPAGRSPTSTPRCRRA